MASTVGYKDYILEELSLLDNITIKKMMGEYLLYCDGILFGGIYDDRLLVKKVKSNLKYNLEDSLPYDGAKSMYLVTEVDNKEYIKELVLDTIKDLKK